MTHISRSTSQWMSIFEVAQVFLNIQVSFPARESNRVLKVVYFIRSRYISPKQTSKPPKLGGKAFFFFFFPNMIMQLFNSVASSAACERTYSVQSIALCI